MSDQHKYTNRLIHESSPYLQQHAHNPVDWYAWSEEAFERAEREDKPIFLSIGYSSCHWCHVMEREVFEDEEIAVLMNETFINVKVDREERPDVDSLYMEFAQSMMAGSAGWPLNLILTPNLKPFYAATYVPPISRQGSIGMRDLVPQMASLWASEERHRVVAQASQIVEAFALNEKKRAGDLPPEEILEAAAEVLFKLSDPTWGGITGAPKFPVGYQESFFLRYIRRYRDSRAMFCAERTLDMMQRGGIRDHIGGGFSRYSVDEKWLVPHFEKMLYDNAILAQSYMEAWQMTHRELYREVSKEIIDYILRDLTHEDGGFFSSEDAETEEREGYYYTWTGTEVADVIGGDKAPVFNEFYDITDMGNFEGRSIPNTPQLLEDFAKEKQLDPQELKRNFAVERQLLLSSREDRQRPARDDKVLISWNGLMLHSLATAAWAFDMPVYHAAALKNGEFLKENLWIDGQLYRRWIDGDCAFEAGLDDYVFLIRGVLTLFESSGDSKWLAWAVQLTEVVEQNFRDTDSAYYQSNGRDPRLIIRQMKLSDGAEPSANSVHTENLLRLHQMTANPVYLERAESIMRTVRPSLESYPPGFCYHLLCLQRYYDRDAPTFVVALNDKQELHEELLPLLYHPFIPHKAVIWRHEGDEQLFDLIPSCRGQGPIDGKTTLYVCRQGRCEEPRTKLTDMIADIHAS